MTVCSDIIPGLEGGGGGKVTQSLSCIKLNVYFQEELRKKSQINVKSDISTTFSDSLSLPEHSKYIKLRLLTLVRV